MTQKLMPDQPAPSLTVPTVGGAPFDLAAQSPENFTMLVFYRGYHCPICKGYLQTLNSLAADYEAAGFSILALSMDGMDRARLAREERGLDKLAIGYDLSEEAARAFGLWISSSIREGETKVFTEPGLFWVRPDGSLYLADISNMPIARPDLAFMLSKAAMLVKNGYPARGTLKAAA